MMMYGEEYSERLNMHTSGNGSVSALVSIINEVNLRRVRLILGWVTCSVQFLVRESRYVTSHLGQLGLPSFRGRWMKTSFGWEGKGRYGSFRWRKCEIPRDRVPYLSALDVCLHCSRRGALQMHVYLTFTYQWRRDGHAMSSLLVH